MHERGSRAHLEPVHGAAAGLVMREPSLKHLHRQAFAAVLEVFLKEFLDLLREVEELVETCRCVGVRLRGEAWGGSTRQVAVQKTSRKRPSVDASWHRRLGAFDLSSAPRLV